MRNLSTCRCLSSGGGRHDRMSQEKQLSNASKEVGCTLKKLTRRTLLLREKNLAGLQELVTAMEVSYTAEEFLAAEDDIQV